ncbi:hypothetical protein Z957_09455 [Clostridium sp. K25]|uniref:hypothetical protein n=1 Tax=Clostridium TaxID=1485 RepID=UPI0004D89605|nr:MULTISPECIES: hypothetical protein [Clostridium]KEI07146.1 hypothetical protein Z957_09455 [Clostridium sp. K25]OOB75717.1 hypothetical protein AXF41_07155 [Clostridium haemolyticum]
MEMYNNELKTEIHTMFQELAVKAKEIAVNSKTAQIATERISEAVSSRVAAESEGYIVDIYTCLVAKIKADEYFQDPNHLNAFYRLNLREKLNDKYHFEVESLDAYKKGIEFKEVNKLYAAAGAAAGTLAVGGILKFAILGLINIPIAVIIAGAVIVGVAAYFSVPEKNKKEYYRAINKFLNDMENEILDWLTEVENYFHSQVRSLYKV